MQDIVDNKKLQMQGIVGLYAANAVGDDIEVYKDDSRTEVLCRWVYLCLTLLFPAVAALWHLRYVQEVPERYLRGGQHAPLSCLSP